MLKNQFMWVNIKKSNKGVNIHDVVLEYGINEDQLPADVPVLGKVHRYLVTQLEPFLELTRIREIKDNLILLYSQTIEAKDTSTLQSGKWYVEIRDAR
jgi:hypothetical protein